MPGVSIGCWRMATRSTLATTCACRCIHTPGHTAGSACFYWEPAQAVFSGDAVGGQGSRVNGYPLYSLAADYRRSLERLLELPIAYLMQAHRYRWSGRR